MHFAHPIPIVVPRPFALAWGVADPRMGTSRFRQMGIGLPLIGVHRRGLRGAFFDKGFQGCPITVFANRQTNLTALSPDHASNRRTIILPSAVAFDLVRPPPR